METRAQAPSNIKNLPVTECLEDLDLFYTAEDRPKKVLAPAPPTTPLEQLGLGGVAVGTAVFGEDGESDEDEDEDDDDWKYCQQASKPAGAPAVAKVPEPSVASDTPVASEVPVAAVPPVQQAAKPDGVDDSFFDTPSASEEPRAGGAQPVQQAAKPDRVEDSFFDTPSASAEPVAGGPPPDEPLANPFAAFEASPQEVNPSFFDTPAASGEPSAAAPSPAAPSAGPDGPKADEANLEQPVAQSSVEAKLDLELL